MSPLPDPVVDERYGIGFEYIREGMAVTLFIRPLVPQEDGEVIDAVPETEPPTIEELPSSNTETRPEKQPRVELEGRVGRDPRVRETKGGTLIAKFPLAEHPDGREGETTWHTIVAFKERAGFVRDNVHKGDQVKVIGYRNEREHDGKTYEEINAVVVKPVKREGETSQS